LAVSIVVGARCFTWNIGPVGTGDGPLDGHRDASLRETLRNHHKPRARVSSISCGTR
jgi:hypothetical protein